MPTLISADTKYSKHSVAEILLDPTISYWLKDAIKSLSNRDTLDALRDVELLKSLWDDKWRREINQLS